ncbi:MAG TPA: response regulator [Candidatus Omnitrophota bacterium]|nr:response regulator [Candidatus Omnitrophota bacterium]
MPGVRKSILIVDDEKDILDSLAVFLRRNGYGVSVADNGTDGLKIAKKDKPNLIILDLMLPDIDGTDVAVELMQERDTRDIPIIFLTSVLTKNEQMESGEIIANRCIVAKPCKTEEILGLIKDRIGSAQ